MRPFQAPSKGFVTIPSIDKCFICSTTIPLIHFTRVQTIYSHSKNKCAKRVCGMLDIRGRVDVRQFPFVYEYSIGIDLFFAASENLTRHHWVFAEIRSPLGAYWRRTTALNELINFRAVRGNGRYAIRSADVCSKMARMRQAARNARV